MVDDEPSVRAALDRALRMDGYRVQLAADGTEALDALAHTPPDAIVLDVLMPEPNGLEVCRRLRAAGDRTPVLMLTARDAVPNRVKGLDAGADDYLVKPFALEELGARLRAAGDRTPVLMLTARDAVPDRVKGLDAGADDYLVKPFALEELGARLRALLRRSGGPVEAPLRHAGIELDLAGHTVHRGERLIELTRTEFLLLELLLRHPRQVLTRSQIFENVWGYDFGPTSNSLEVYVGYLRRKLGEPRLIQTVRGVGYVLREP